jgi:hypothetical protein
MSKIFNKTNLIKYQDILLILLLIIATILLNKPGEDSFWRFDDPAILKCAIEYSWWEHFVIPESYHCLSSAHLTPWVTFSYAIDYNLFGLEPKFFYYHQILSLSLVSIFSFILLRLYVNSYIAFFGILLFLVGSPVWVSSQQLMIRHYIEGLLFSILSIYFFILSLRFQKYRYALLGCLFYILATTAKEIYVPLLGILLFIPEGKLKARLYAVLPYFTYGFSYIVWRKYMLSIFIGGYTPTIDFSNYFNQQLIDNLNKIPTLILSGEYANIVVALTLFIAWISLKKYFIQHIIYSCLLILPILPLLSQNYFDIRFVILLWWSFCVLIFVVYHRVDRNYLLFGLYSVVIGLLAWQTIDKRNETRKNIKQVLAEFDQQGRFYWRETEQKTLIASSTPLTGSWYFLGLKNIKLRLLNQSSPYLLSFNLPVLPEQPLSTDIWQYNAVSQQIEKVPFETIQRYLYSNVILEKPLAVFVKNNYPIIHWKFKPYLTENYYLIQENDSLGVPIPHEGSALFYNKLTFRIRYNSPEGWITYSPEFILEKNQTIDWKRF